MNNSNKIGIMYFINEEIGVFLKKEKNVWGNFFVELQKSILKLMALMNNESTGNGILYLNFNQDNGRSIEI